MESRGPIHPLDLSALRIDVLRRAVEIYLQHAYPQGEVPAAVRRRLEWPETGDITRLLTGPPFEKASTGGPDKPPVFALRLGNARYPHMKLQIQPWPAPTGFLLSVNTHDQVQVPDPTSPEAESFRALQAENQHFKEVIETAWDEAGLPTFLRYLRDYIQAQPEKRSESKGSESPSPGQGGHG